MCTLAVQVHRYILLMRLLDHALVPFSNCPRLHSSILKELLLEEEQGLGLGGKGCLDLCTMCTV